MANNNVQNVRFLRNGSLYLTRDAALTGINSQTLGSEQDGSIILARYGSGNDVKTLAGFVYSNGSNQSLTIFDIEGAASDVQSLREEINAKLGTGITSSNTATAQLEALSGATFTAGTSNSADTSVEGAKAYAYDLVGTLDVTDTAVPGSYVSQVSQADGKIAVTRVALPDASSVADDNKVVTDVTQSKGQITATASNITGVKLAGYAVGSDAKIAATDTLGEALGKLQGQINGMDKDASAVDGQVVTTVAEADGKVTETKANVKDLQLGGYVKNASATGAIASTDTVNEALSKLENKAAAITITNADGSINVTTATTGTDINVNIKTGDHVLAKDGNAGIYTNIAISAVTGTELTDLGTNVKEAYKLVGTDGSKLGEYVKIYKDSSISKIYLGYSTDTVDEDSGVITSGTTGEAQSLNYVYHKEDGKYEMVHVDVSKFLVESEFASGVTADATGVVHGVVDTTSETNSGGTAFLTVGVDGFKVSGIKQEIIDRINELDAVVTGGTTAGTVTSNHVQVIVGEADGKLTGVTVTETNVADKDKLETLSAKTFTVATSSNESITTAVTAAADGTKSVDLITDASKIKMSGFTAGASGFTAISESSSVTEAFKAVETFTLENEEITAAALTDLDERINELTSASTEALNAEIAERRRIEGQNASSYTVNASSTFISGASNMNDADVKLDAALKALSDRTVDQVKVNGKALDEDNNAVNIQISATNGTGAASTPFIVKTDDSTGAVTIQLEGLDCGTY